MNLSISKISCHEQSQDFFSHLRTFIPAGLLEEISATAKRKRVYDPLTTIQLSIYQAWESLSLKGTIAKLNTTRALKKLTPISMNTGAFCRAKARLNEDLLKSLALKVNTSDKNFLWKNRHVKIVDGTTMMMEDTMENQSKFPQMSRQKKRSRPAHP
jgi:hypothetical protein